MKTKRKNVMGILAMVLIVVLLVGCASKSKDSADESATNGYKQITQEEAAKMMEENSDVIILDVRTQAEYSEGHIPNAICVPNEEIVDAQPAEIPDLDQVILVYCRSGNRSKQASQKLADMGYTNIYEFGGIKDWTGDVVTD